MPTLFVSLHDFIQLLKESGENLPDNIGVDEWTSFTKEQTLVYLFFYCSQNSREGFLLKLIG